MSGDDIRENTDTFQVTSLQEAELFAAYIGRYGDSVCHGYDIRDHFRNVFNYSRVHSTSDRVNGKLLNAYIDLELTHLFMMKDSLLAGGTHNRLHNTGKTDLGSVLDDFDLFSSKMNILYSLSALSFRVRAFWDKYMGVLFLLYQHQEYENYVNARSRRAFFIKRAKEWPDISIHLRKCLTNIVRTWLIHSGQREAVKNIDVGKFCVPFPHPFLEILSDMIDMVDAIRTPEAHGAGFLRKWTLSNLPIDRSRDFSLLNHWNHSNEFIQGLRTTIAELSAQSLSPQR